jgi:hypothetical protein
VANLDHLISFEFATIIIVANINRIWSHNRCPCISVNGFHFEKNNKNHTILSQAKNEAHFVFFSLTQLHSRKNISILAKIILFVWRIRQRFSIHRPTTIKWWWLCKNVAIDFSHTLVVVIVIVIVFNSFSWDTNVNKHSNVVTLCWSEQLHLPSWVEMVLKNKKQKVIF